MNTSNTVDKAVATVCAQAALQGIEATPSRNERGQATVILRRGVWVREIRPEQLAEALAEAKALQEASTA